MKEGDGLTGAPSQMMKAFETLTDKKASNTQTYRQGLQPLFVELSLLTRHPEVVGGRGKRWGEEERKGV